MYITLHLTDRSHSNNLLSNPRTQFHPCTLSKASRNLMLQGSCKLLAQRRGKEWFAVSRQNIQHLLLLLLRRGETVSVELRSLAGPLNIPQMIHELIWSNGGMIMTGENRRTRGLTAWAMARHEISTCLPIIFCTKLPLKTPSNVCTENLMQIQQTPEMRWVRNSWIVFIYLLIPFFAFWCVVKSVIVGTWGHAKKIK
jgi:hypothetical protein